MDKRDRANIIHWYENHCDFVCVWGWVGGWVYVCVRFVWTVITAVVYFIFDLAFITISLHLKTQMSNPQAEENKGLLPRILRQLLSQCSEEKNPSVEQSIAVQMVHHLILLLCCAVTFLFGMANSTSPF